MHPTGLRLCFPSALKKPSISIRHERVTTDTKAEHTDHGVIKGGLNLCVCRHKFAPNQGRWLLKGEKETSIRYEVNPWPRVVHTMLSTNRKSWQTPSTLNNLLSRDNLLHGINFCYFQLTVTRSRNFPFEGKRTWPSRLTRKMLSTLTRIELPVIHSLDNHVNTGWQSWRNNEAISRQHLRGIPDFVRADFKVTNVMKPKPNYDYKLIRISI